MAVNRVATSFSGRSSHPQWRVKPWIGRTNRGSPARPHLRVQEQLPVTITVSPTGAALPGGNQNVAYSQQLSAAGGNPPYEYSIASGTLPVGLTLSAVGRISGTPTVVGGPTGFTVRVRDAEGRVQTKAYTITIAA